jgi:hypothetical protein
MEWIAVWHNVAATDRILRAMTWVFALPEPDEMYLEDKYARFRN